MKKSSIDLSDIKEDELGKTSSFTDLMNKHQRKEYLREKELEKRKDIDEILTEKKSKVKSEEKKKEENLMKTQALELTRSMKFNFDEVKKENNEIKKDGKKKVSKLNIIGEINLLCIGYYIYLLGFTNFQDNKDNYMLNGAIIVLLVLFFGMSVVTNKKIRKLFMLINIFTLITFILFNVYTIVY